MEDFECSLDCDVELFLKQKAIQFDKSDIGRTYIIYDTEINEKENKFIILGYFTVALKTFKFSDAMSKNQKKRLAGMFSNVNDAVAYLIGQVARNYKYPQYKQYICISDILKHAIDVIGISHENVGGRFIFLDCKKENEKVIELYNKNGFKICQSWLSPDGTEYVQMVRSF